MSITHQRRRELRLRQVQSVIEAFQDLSKVESSLHKVIESGDIIKGVEIASELEVMVSYDDSLVYDYVRRFNAVYLLRLDAYSN